MTAGYWDYGPNWDNTKARWRRSRWTRKRCFWCRRRKHVTIDAHHLLYPRPPKMAGDVSIFWLRPMCRTCHKIETWIARNRRKHMANGRKRYAHLYVTYGGRWLINITCWLPVIYLWFRFHGSTVN
jgi:hypothetical protein